MKVELSRYRINMDFIKYCYKNCKHGDLVLLVSEISASVPIPCIVVNKFLQEIAGETPELVKNFESLKKDYTIDEVVE